MFYYDPYYWIILVPAFLISLLAQIRVSSTFGRFGRVGTARHITGCLLYTS